MTRTTGAVQPGDHYRGTWAACTSFLLDCPRKLKWVNVRLGLRRAKDGASSLCKNSLSISRRSATGSDTERFLIPPWVKVCEEERWHKTSTRSTCLKCNAWYSERRTLGTQYGQRGGWESKRVVARAVRCLECDERLQANGLPQHARCCCTFTSPSKGVNHFRYRCQNEAQMDGFGKHGVREIGCVLRSYRVLTGTA